MRTQLTRLMRSGLVLCSLALLSTVLVVGCTPGDSSDPTPTSSPDGGGGGSGSQDDGGSSTQGGGGGSSSR